MKAWKANGKRHHSKGEFVQYPYGLTEAV